MDRRELQNYFRSLRPNEIREFRMQYLGEMPQEDFAYSMFLDRKTVYRWESQKNHSTPDPISAGLAVEKFGEQLERYYMDKQAIEATV